MTPFDFRPRTRIVFGPGEFSRLGEIARELGGSRCLVVADPGMVEVGYVQEAVRSLKARRMEVFAFHEFESNPTSKMIEAGYAHAAPLNVNLVVGLGGGSSLDCAKAINLLLTNGGSIRDFRGYGKVQKPSLPMIAVPTTAGTGSEAQSDIVIVDSDTKDRIRCGDAKLAYRTAVLDPKLTLSQPAEIAAASGYDAISHAIETLVSPRRNAISECFSREAWRLLDANFERVLKNREDLDARGAMLVGAHFAGIAVEYSTLGPAHALAHPLTAGFRVPHGAAIALVLSSTMEWNGVNGEFDSRRLRELAEIAELPTSLQDVGVPEEALPRLADQAAAQWSGRFGARPLDPESALEIYRAAF